MTAPLVLVVDDDADLRETLAIVLDAEGYRVAVAADGDAAQRYLLEGERPALVLLDVMMPGMDGDQLLEWAEGCHLGVPIVIMTGHDAARVRSAGGAAGSLQKPVDLDTLLAVVARFCGATSSSAALPSGP